MSTGKKKSAILYSRVSTLHDEQAESIENQMLLARNYLDRHPEIELAEPLDKYSEKISAKTDNRPKFQELCERLSRGDIQYLMIKDLKRLSRSVETTYAFFNLMKQYDFEIIQLSTGNIIDCQAFEEVESNLLLGIEALFAQNTVLTQSRYGRTVQRVRCENKQLSCKDAQLFGYAWDNTLKDVVIVEEKAEIIRELFNRYVFRNEGITELREYLASLGYPYSAVSVSKWLQEGKYIGDWTINRKGSTLGIGQGAKSHRFTRDKAEWVHIDRPDLAIVDKEMFDLAQEMRSGRVRKYLGAEGQERSVGGWRGKHLFANKIVCAECGCNYRFRWANRAQTIAVYIDSNRSAALDLSKKCPNQRFKKIYEEEIKEIVISAIQTLNITGKVSLSRIMDAISASIQRKNNPEKNIETERIKLRKLERDAEKITSAFIDATPAMRGRLNDQLELIEKQKEGCKEQIARLSNLSNDVEKMQKRLADISEQLSAWINISKESLSRSIVEKLINKISIHKDGRIDIAINFGSLKNYQLGHPINNGQETDRPQIKVLSQKGVKENVERLYQDSVINGCESTQINLAGFQGEDKTVVVSLDAKL